MAGFTDFEILETLRMFEEEHLDVRTITMGINLLDCSAESSETICRRIYDKICLKAENLVKTSQIISNTLGVPIINTRIAVTPISLVAAGARTDNYLPFAKAMDKAAENCGVNFIGGFSALVQKGFTDSDRAYFSSLSDSLASTERVCASVNAAATRSGINMDAVRDIGPILLDLAQKTSDRDAYGCAKFVIFANAPEDNPFMAGAFCGTGEAETVINVGVSGPGAVLAQLKKMKPEDDIRTVCEQIKRTAFKITRVGQLVAKEAASRLGSEFGVIDLSLAPTPAEGDSIAEILESIGLESCGAWGTTAALAMLNDSVKKGGMMAATEVGGLSGAFIPVSEDSGMIRAVERGSLSLEKLEAMTSVCSVGIDMVAVPGDTEAAVISGIIADELAIGTFNNKTTAVRVIPVPGKKVGDKVSYGGLWGDAPIMAVNQASPSIFISRGGHIPAPIHSMRN